MNPFMLCEEQKNLKQTNEENQAEEYRCNITKMLYSISNVAILNYIHIIVSDIAKESESGMKV